MPRISYFRFMLKKFGLIFITLLLFTACGGSKEEEVETTKPGVWGNKVWVTLGFRKMILPETIKTGGIDISFDQGTSYVDYKNGLRFSYDEIYKTAYSYYQESFPVLFEAEDPSQSILNVAVHLRRSAMYSNQVSLEERIKGDYGNDIRTVIVTGKENSYSEKYAFIYATSNNANYTYLYQFVCLEENLKFYYQEIVNSLASTKSI